LKVLSSRDLPGIISARKVTFISGRAQTAAAIDRFGFRLNQLILRLVLLHSFCAFLFEATDAGPNPEGPRRSGAQAARSACESSRTPVYLRGWFFAFLPRLTAKFSRPLSKFPEVFANIPR